MPGLFGIINLNPESRMEESEGKNILSKMAKALCHNESERVEQTYVSEADIFIGRVGLANHYPFEGPYRSEDAESTIRLFVSGPLLERETDNSLYRVPDADTFQSWHGFFSVVLTEVGRDTTLLVADRRASVPIYYFQAENQLFFAPEIKALMVASNLFKKEVDLGAFATFLAQGFLVGEQTLFKGVKRLQGGKLLRIENGQVSKETYWRFLPGSTYDNSSQTDLEDELGILLDEAAKKHMGEPDETVIFLSGGADSRGILGGALASVQGHGELLNTVSWGENQGTKDSDVALAAVMARRLKMNHRFFERRVTNYRENFRYVNALIDGLSEIAAFHPHEYRIMEELRNLGYKRVLRGDEAFGLKYFSASTLEGASTVAYLCRLYGLQDLIPIVRETYYNQLCEASDAAIDSALNEARDLSPNQAKDFFYFSHRLQCYLQTASYYKQIELDHRNVLLDDPILDFLTKVPDSMRVDKMLFRQTIIRRYPQLVQFPYAKRSNLEDWLKLLATDSPVRQYALDELGDRSSGIWEYLDPEALTKMMTDLSMGFSFRSMLAQRLNLKPLIKQSLTIFAPRLLTRIRSQRRARPVANLGVDKIIMRSLALKNWFDTFV